MSTSLKTAFIANNDTGSILFHSSAEGVGWSDNLQVGQASKAAPSLAFVKFKL